MIRALLAVSCKQATISVRRACFILALAALTVAGSSALLAQVSPNGGEFEVNTYTTDYQGAPAVAAASDGDFVVIWDSQGSGQTDSSYVSIQMRRYAANGAPLAGELQVNTYTTSFQRRPAVAVDGLGNFVVAWESDGSSGADTGDYSIQGQRFDSAGTPLGSQFQVNGDAPGNQNSSAVAASTLGTFVVVWTSGGSTGTDSSSQSVQARRYLANGTPASDEFQVNTYTTSFQRLPAVAVDGLGNFVVVWESLGSSGGDTSSYSIQAQRYLSDGSPAGFEFQVNTYTTDRQRLPALTMDAQGNFVVAWESIGSLGGDTDSYSVQARRYAANGTPLGAEFQVNTYTTSTQYRPAVASDAAGNFVVAWESGGASGGDTSGASVHARRYAADGTPLSDSFQINSSTSGHQSLPALAVDGQGNFVVSWESYASAGNDTSGTSIQAQRFDGVFRDGFESGSTSRWSATAP